MSEQRRAERFSAALDDLLAIGEGQPGAAESLSPAERELARRLATDLSTTSRARSTTRARLLQQAAGSERAISRGVSSMDSSRHIATAHPPRRRILSGSARALIGALALVTALFVGVPDLRAFTVSVLRQFGTVALTDEQISPSAAPTNPLSPTAAPPPASPQPVAGAREASTRIGATVLAPGTVPAGYTPRGWEVLQLFDGTSAVAYFTSADGHYLSVAQIVGADSAEALRLAAGDALIRDVRVRGHAGALVEGVAMGHQAPGDPEARLLPTNLLVWEEGGVTFLVSADALGEAELLAVAEGLGR